MTNQFASRRAHARGFTLIELMIAVAIIAIISAVALPLYSNYIQTSREGVLVTNIATMEIFQEDFRLRTGSYLLAAANTAAIEAAIGWTPQDGAGFTYSIADGGGGSYEVTATDPSGTSVCMRYPQKVRC
ncbi:MAG: prepilin-type N-terminal cleavage/methylation domain-containing protein [Pseudomonadales bacterium]